MALCVGVVPAGGLLRDSITSHFGIMVGLCDERQTTYDERKSGI